MNEPAEMMEQEELQSTQLVEAESASLVANQNRPPAIEASDGVSPLVAMAMSSDIDPARLDKLLDIQIKYEKSQAERAYAAALARFNAVAPTLKKTKKVKFTTKDGSVTEYNHGDIAVMLEQLRQPLAQCGLAVSWKVRQENGGVLVTCVLRHEQGHYEDTSLHASPDQSGKKNAIQQVGSTIQYLKRYTLEVLLGLATEDADDDGAGAGDAPGTTHEGMTRTKRSYLRSLLKQKGRDPAQVLKLLHSKGMSESVQTLEAIPNDLGDYAIARLEGLPDAEPQE